MLVVDDDENVLDGMKTVLTDWGCRVVAARRPVEALDAARTLGDGLDVEVKKHQPHIAMGIENIGQFVKRACLENSANGFHLCQNGSQTFTNEGVIVGNGDFHGEQISSG